MDWSRFQSGTPRSFPSHLTAAFSLATAPTSSAMSVLGILNVEAGTNRVRALSSLWM